MIIWLLLVVILWYILFRFRRKRMYELARRLQTAKGTLPVIGTLYLVSGSNEGKCLFHT